MIQPKLTLRLLIYGLIATAFVLGVPQLHYTAALMIAVIIRHKDQPGGLFGPIESFGLAERA